MTVHSCPVQAMPVSVPGMMNRTVKTVLERLMAPAILLLLAAAVAMAA